MKIVFGKQDAQTLPQAQSRCVLLTNGLGGYASVTGAWSVNRADQGLLVAAVKAPNVRVTLVHRMKETLTLEGRAWPLSVQEFGGKIPTEEGLYGLSMLEYDGLPVWTYEIGGVTVRRSLAMASGENTVAVCYALENDSPSACTLTLEPFLKFAPKEAALTEKKPVRMEGNRITDGRYSLYIHTDGVLEQQPRHWQTLAYQEDVKDGRPGKGLAVSCCRITQTLAAGERRELAVVFSDREATASAKSILEAARLRRQALENDGGFRDPLARTLAAASDDFIVRRDSTDGKTIVAGYPLFSDWGRDTMIALPGCCLATGRYEDARSILRTFLAYEQDGLVPNLFPEGGSEPMYNTVDAALLLIDCVWQYALRSEDMDFVREAWLVMERIIAAYRRGTHHAISMDTDGLIRSGSGLDQVTWMDVCIDGVLPTPRHGKCVEINAYWYNALRIMDTLGQRLGLDARDYGSLARQVKESFLEKFYIEGKGYLRDVLSGGAADEQIRCNQIWAVSMPFTMLTPEQAEQVVLTVYRHLYTPCGLRSLSPADQQFRGGYGGAQFDRDMAYHQGTAWVFPLGAFYRAWIKVYGQAGAVWVKRRIGAMESMLREGCLGQLPEIYSGGCPGEGKGCFAQAWSVGELLRVMETLEKGL